jgi:hypothetical protein
VGVIWDCVLLRPRTSRKRTVWILTQVKFKKQAQKTSFFFPFSDIFEDDFDRVRSKIEAQSGLRPV